MNLRLATSKLGELALPPAKPMKGLLEGFALQAPALKRAA